MTTAGILVIVAMAVAGVSLIFLRLRQDLYDCAADPAYGQYSPQFFGPPALGMYLPLSLPPAEFPAPAVAVVIPRPRTPR
jgi:hypothetical protein